ncbi:hypothetical protein M9H77_06600 [Catharanthus roseus]|uniref:Uncharacterized protein n=1 Tax=Catharanthus roseus TaxID=4058 RepID=A0ACC0BSI7_CATRO|nr:hypothetical protein M9H77_06600 [Catharanthus roseus]
MNVQEVIDENDEKLTSLRKEFGDDDEVYKVVIRASNELNEYNPSGIYTVPELWNPLEGWKASLKEGLATRDLRFSLGNHLSNQKLICLQFPMNHCKPCKQSSQLLSGRFHM